MTEFFVPVVPLCEALRLLLCHFPSFFGEESILPFASCAAARFPSFAAAFSATASFFSASACPNLLRACEAKGCLDTPFVALMYPSLVTFKPFSSKAPVVLNMPSGAGRLKNWLFGTLDEIFVRRSFDKGIYHVDQCLMRRIELLDINRSAHTKGPLIVVNS